MALEKAAFFFSSINRMNCLCLLPMTFQKDVGLEHQTFSAIRWLYLHILIMGPLHIKLIIGSAKSSKRNKITKYTLEQLN